MTRAAITVENLSKAYHIGLKEDRADTLVGALHGLVRAPVRNFRRLARMNTFKHCGEAEDIYWALKDVSFEVAEGEVVGIIGRNGAGKSTLLKILSRITEPTSGRAVIRGRVSSLLEVGTGFHQELSGRENVYMNGTILGMTKREIDRKFDEIVDFSGVEKFLDTPIKHYSSGMKVRLAFSVAAHLEPEILIIDEVLAVGDADFQKKCLGKMQDVAKRGRTVLFVSHNMVAVQNLCHRAIVLRIGSVHCIDDTSLAIADHLGTVRSDTASSHVDLRIANGRRSGAIPMMREVEITSRGVCVDSFATGDPIEFALRFDSERALTQPALGIAFKTQVGENIGCINNKFMSAPRVQSPVRRGTVSCSIPRLMLLPGEYVTDFYFGDKNGDYDVIESAARVAVRATDVYGTGKLPPRGFGSWVIEASWELLTASSYSTTT